VRDPSALTTVLVGDARELPLEIDLLFHSDDIGLPMAIAPEFSKIAIMDVQMLTLALRSESTFGAGLATGADRGALRACEQLGHGCGAAGGVPVIHGLMIGTESPGDRVFDSTMHERSAGMIDDQSVILAGIRPEDSANHLPE